MGLLDKLWDDTVAGPRPDTGLSRLRKPSSPSSSSVVPSPNAVKDASAAAEAAPRVTRSIMIKRPAPASAGCPSPTGCGTPPPSPSPAGSTPPLSPFAATFGPRGHPWLIGGGMHLMRPRWMTRMHFAADERLNDLVSRILLQIGGGRLRRKSLSDAYERGGGFGPKSPAPPFDV